MKATNAAVLSAIAAARGAPDPGGRAETSGA